MYFSLPPWMRLCMYTSAAIAQIRVYAKHKKVCSILFRYNYYNYKNAQRFFSFYQVWVVVFLALFFCHRRRCRHVSRLEIGIDDNRKQNMINSIFVIFIWLASRFFAFVCWWVEWNFAFPDSGRERERGVLNEFQPLSSRCCRRRCRCLSFLMWCEWEGK